jgi:uncharacterized protein YdaU (DUF1376 family)
MPWYTGHFMTSTRGWSVTAKGVYRELLDAQWDRGVLPADPKELRGLIGATPAEWRAWASLVEAKFPLCPDGMRRNARCDRDRQNQLAKSAMRQEFGSRGGKASAERRASITRIRGGA